VKYQVRTTVEYFSCDVVESRGISNPLVVDAFQSKSPSPSSFSSSQAHPSSPLSKEHTSELDGMLWDARCERRSRALHRSTTRRKHGRGLAKGIIFVSNSKQRAVIAVETMDHQESSTSYYICLIEYTNANH